MRSHFIFMAAARHLRRRMPQEREDAQLLRECRPRLVYMHGTVHNEQCTYACGEREDLAVQIFCYSYHFYYGTIAPRVGLAGRRRVFSLARAASRSRGRSSRSGFCRYKDSLTYE